jgi:hypothetical protein
MKKLLLILLFTGFSRLFAQPPLNYNELLLLAPEINIADSMHFDAGETEITALDSATVKKWFSGVLPTEPNNRLKNRKYALAGKITSAPTYDLLVLLEEKRKTDSTTSRVMYFITTKKDGKFIASLEAAISGSKKKSDYHISSFLHCDYKITQHSSFRAKDTLYADLTYYKINSGGRFILYPKY